MVLRLLLYGIFIVAFFFFISACTGEKEREEPVVFKTVPEIQNIKPEKPVKIKFKRNAKGTYSWDISGENPEKILEADKALRETLNKQDYTE